MKKHLLQKLEHGGVYRRYPVNALSDKSQKYGFEVSLLRRIVVYIFAALLCIMRSVNAVMNLFRHGQNNKSVVILEPFGLGDVITHEPLIRLLSDEGYSVTFCARPVWRSIIQESSNVHWQDVTVPWASAAFDDKYSFSIKYFRSLLEAVKSIGRYGRGSIGIDTRGDVRSIFMLQAAGCRKVYSLSHYIGSSLHLPYCGTHRVRQDPTKLRWQLNLCFAAAMGVKRNFSEVAAPSLNHLLHAVDLINESSTIAMIPFAAGAGKRWTVEGWQKLINIIEKYGLHPIWFCGPGEQDELSDVFGNKVDHHEIKSVQEWINELSSVRAVISVNTGPMHIASALNIPLVVMDGSSTFPLWMPAGEHSMLIHHQKQLMCAPCHQVDSRFKCKGECMGLITPQEVASALFSGIELPSL
jgi:ADP-heptose:LPS heptosyltransferase